MSSAPVGDVLPCPEDPTRHPFSATLDVEGWLREVRRQGQAASIIDLDAARARRPLCESSRETFLHPWHRVAVGRALVDCLTYGEAVEAVCELAGSSERRECVVTPNIQHVAELRRGGEFAAAYAEAALVLPDGAPIVLTLRVLTGRKQARVTGADLLPGICRAAAEKGLTVGLLGGRPGAAQAAASRMQDEFPGLQVSLVEPAPWGFDTAPAQLDEVLDHVAARNPDILFIGLGSPKTEIFVLRHRERLGSGVVLCVGAAIDFSAGLAVRAPLSWQRVGCEWLWRVVHEPRRLLARYLKAAPRFLVAVFPAVVRTLFSRTFGKRIRLRVSRLLHIRP